MKYNRTYEASKDMADLISYANTILDRKFAEHSNEGGRGSLDRQYILKGNLTKDPDDEVIEIGYHSDPMIKIRRVNSDKPMIDKTPNSYETNIDFMGCSFEITQEEFHAAKKIAKRLKNAPWVRDNYFDETISLSA